MKQISRPVLSRVVLLSTVALVGVALAGAGCARPAATPGATGTPSAAPSASVPVSPSPTTPTPTTTTTTTTKVYGPVWPLEPRTISSIPHSGAARLTAIRTGRHDTYERLVLDFAGAYGAVRIRYVPLVHADPSDLVVPLQGNAFLEVSVQDAYARWGAGGGTPAYDGPNSVHVGFPTLKQVAVSGDFEAVLSFGIGLDRVAGFTVMRLRSPDRLVIDVAIPPAWRMWPDNSLTQAKQAQQRYEDGELSWRSSVVAHYARLVYGWPEPVITRVPGTDEYWVSASGSSERIRVRQVWPFRDTRPSSIAEIADVR